jgi:hypothetical protein
MDQSSVEEAPLAPLVGLVERLRAEVTQMQGREALGEELEAKRRRLKLAEATVELLMRPREEEEAVVQGEEGAEGVCGALPQEKSLTSKP